MDMKNHIIAALREEFERWEELLAGMDEAQISTPLLPSPWTTKDVVAHLWAWQQRSIARVKAAALDQPPEFPHWPVEADPDAEGSTDRTNAWIYETNRDLPWSTVHRSWRDGFEQFLQLAEQRSERDLLDLERYPWLNGYSLAVILLSSYDHHQEHYENLVTWQREQMKL
jgi:hypothetical protein